MNLSIPMNSNHLEQRNFSNLKYIYGPIVYYEIAQFDITIYLWLFLKILMSLQGFRSLLL